MHTTHINATRMRRYSVRVLLVSLVWCLSIWGMAGCSGTAPPPHPLPDLHIPGVSKVPHSDRVAQQTGTHRIDAITTYAAPPGGHAARILALVGDGVFDIGVDGSAFHEIPLTVPCFVGLSVTADSQWGACQSEHGIEVFGLSGPSKGRSKVVLQNPDGEVLRTPSWAPDGQHLAAASRLHGAGINIYTISSAYDSLQLTARLTFDRTTAESVWWSADGEWLVVQGGGSLYLVHVGPLLPQLFGHEDAPVTIRVAQDAIRDVVGGSPVAWMHAVSTVHAATVTLAGGDGGIVQQNVVTGQQVTLLTQQVGYICGLAWTPDNSQLVFALCGPSSIEFIGPPTVLYTFTPST